MNEDELREAKREYQNKFGQFRINSAILTNYYEQKMDLGKLPKDVQIYVSPRCRKDIDVAVAHFLNLGEKVLMPVPAQKKNTKETVSKLIDFGTASLTHFMKVKGNLKRICGKNGFLTGLYVLKAPIYTPRFAPEREKGESKSDYSDRIKTFEESLETTFPFICRPVHWEHISFDDPDEPSIFFEEFKRKAGQVKADFPNWKFDGSDYQDVDYCEIWTDKQRAYFVNNELVEDAENDYGFAPYVIGDAGFGLDMGQFMPDIRYAGLISPALSSYLSESRMMTAIQRGYEYGLFGRMTVVEEPVDGEFKLSNVPGEVSVIPKRYEFHIEEVPDILNSAYAFLGMVRGDQEFISPHNIMGVSQKYQSGLAAGINVGQAKLTYMGIVDSWEKTLATVLDRLAYLVKNVVKEPVGVTGNIETPIISIKPSDIEDDMRYFVKMDTMSPEEKYNRQMLGIRHWQSGTLPHEEINRDYFDKDPEKMEQMKLVEMAMTNPAIAQAIVMKALTGAGMQMELDAIMKGAVPPQPQEDFRNSDYGRKLAGGQTPNIQELGTQPEQGETTFAGETSE